MPKTKGNKGFTFIEIIIATFILVFMVLGSMTLITRVYTGVLSTNLKTYSFNLCTENIEIMKTYTFGALKVTDDSLLPADPLTKLEVDDLSKNPYGNPADPDNLVQVGGVPMKVYRIVQYAVEDEDGNIVPKKEEELPSNYEKNLKSIRVVVEYQMKMGNVMTTKYTELTTYVSNAETSFAGCTIRGIIFKMERNCFHGHVGCGCDGNSSDVNCQCNPPGQMANITVYIEGHPEYTTTVINDNTSPYDGQYIMRNVLPGKYNIYASGPGFAEGQYYANPLTIEIGDTEKTCINIVAPMENETDINGNVRLAGVNILASDYKTTKIWADDGMSFPTEAKTDGTYTITNADRDAPYSPATFVTVYAMLVDPANNVYYGTGTIASLNGNPSVNIDVSPAPSGTGSIEVFAIDGRDKNTAIQDVNVTLQNVASGNTITAATNALGSAQFINIPVGNYRITAAKSCYTREKSGELYKTINVVPSSPPEKVYLIPAGSISGTITEEITGQPPSVPVNIQAFSANKKIAEAFSDTTTGQYLLENVYAINQNSVRLYFDEREYTAIAPENAMLSGISVSQCGTTANQNFTIRLSYDSIKGSISMTGIPQNEINNGAMVIMQPMSNPRMPHEYRLDSTDADKKKQNALNRRTYPFFGSVAKRNGTFDVLVPRGSVYDLYAYYSYVSYTSSEDKKGTIVKFYKKISNVVPGAVDQDFTGTWTAY